jgi:hypothetical protein
MKIQIRHRASAAILFDAEYGSLKLAVEAAVKSGADLRGAYLRGAYLGGAYLGGAYLRGADLRGTDLGGAHLHGADLGGAHLHGANLRGADLGGRKINGDFGLIEAGTPNHWPALGFIDAETGDLIVSVGCRMKTISDGRAYWSSDSHPKRDNRREVLAALDYIEAVAKLRGWSAP